MTRMRKILTWLRILFKRQMKKASLYIVLGVLVLSSLGIKYAAENFTVSIRIGVANLDDGSVSEMIEKALYEHDGLIEFVNYESREELIEALQAGDVYGGYLIKTDFSKRLLEGDTEEIIEAFSTPGNIISSVANEMFFSYVMKELCYEELAADTIETELFDTLTEEEIRQELREYFEENLSDGSTFSLSYENTPENYEGKFTTIDIMDYISPIIMGLVGLMIFIGGLCGSLNFYDDSKNGSFVLLSSRLKGFLGAVEIAIPVFIITVVGVIVLIVTGMESVGAAVAIKYIIYDVIVIVYCYILKMIIRSKEIFVSFIPVLCLMSILFCPVFTNIAAMSQTLGNVGKVLPLYWLYQI